MRTTSKVVLTVPIGVAALLLAGCASTPAEPADGGAVAASYDCSTPDSSSTVNVSISAQPIVSNGALYAGVEEGFFSKHGIDLEIQPVANVAASIASVQGGTSDFGFATTVTTLQSIDSGIPVEIIAPFAGIAPGYYDKMQAGEEGFTTEITALVARDGSGVETPSDLEGLTIAVADARGQSELTTRYVIEEDGGDPDAVQYTVMAFPDALNTFLAGQVDAIFTVDPFLSQAVDAGGTVISWPGVETFHEGPTSGIIASEQFIADEPETVARMNCALQEASAFANDDPDAIRAATAAAQGVDPSTLANAVVPYFYETFDMDGLERFKDIMLDAGFITNDVDLEDVVIPEARAS